MALGVCTVLSVFLLAVTSLGDPTMKSVRHNPSDGSLYVQTDTPRPEIRDGLMLVKVAHVALAQALLTHRYLEADQREHHMRTLDFQTASTVP